MAFLSLDSKEAKEAPLNKIGAASGWPGKLGASAKSTLYKIRHPERSPVPPRRERDAVEGPSRFLAETLPGGQGSIVHGRLAAFSSKGPALVTPLCPLQATEVLRLRLAAAQGNNASLK